MLCYAELGNSTTTIFGGLARRIKIPVIPQSLPILNSDKRKIYNRSFKFFFKPLKLRGGYRDIYAECYLNRLVEKQKTFHFYI